ncbi:MAG: hypothetical protein H8D58_01095 [Candidatus Marinimicrobia bacterium]|nr:hypothetical protein [Candidatus Neomarinimicrobiota bacterium]
MKKIDQDIIIYGYGPGRKNGKGNYISLKLFNVFDERGNGYDIGLRLQPF